MAQTVTVDRTAPPQHSSVSESVVSAVAELTGEDPRSLQPLYDAVDPDALDSLFESGGSTTSGQGVRVEFTYCGCDVVVSGAGDVSVSESP